MRTFCSDRDLLKYESEIFAGSTFSQFVLCRGYNATLSNGYLSCNNVDFSASGVGAGNVVFVSDEVNGWQGLYEVIQCVLAGQIRVSTLRAGIEDELIAMPNATGLKLHIVSFKPVIYELSFELAKYFSLAPAAGGDGFNVDDIADITVIRDAAVFGTLARLWAIMPFGTDEIANRRTLDKHRYYREHYHRLRQGCTIAIDVGGDGNIDAVIAGGVITLKRG